MAQNSSAPPTQPFPFPTADHHEAPPHSEKPVAQEPTDTAIDSGVEESFPASDPVSVTVSKVITPKCEPGAGDDQKLRSGNPSAT
ncbi:MAG: hypothetical protein JWQ03_51 [Variovorax sp.]|nr:hypothetical protein [Variovorax sp.]